MVALYGGLLIPLDLVRGNSPTRSYRVNLSVINITAVF